MRFSVLVNIVLAIAGVMAAAWSVDAGIRLRQEAWERTAAQRFTGDVQNAMRHGAAIVRPLYRGGQEPTVGQTLQAVFARYDRVAATARDGRYGLDYPPLRLTIAAFWHRSLHVPGERSEYRDEHVRPLLRFNMGMELAAALGVGLSAYAACRPMAGRRGRPMAALDDAAPTSRRTAALAGLLGALLVWFNPALIINAHIWPQWDSWVLAPYAFGVFLVLRNCWVAAGVCLAIGCMLKGQTLIGAAVLPLVALFGLKLPSLVMLACGLMLGGGLIALPFAYPGEAPWWALGCCVGAALVGWTGALEAMRRRVLLHAVAGAAAVGMTLAGLLLLPGGSAGAALWLVFFVAVAVGLPRWTPRAYRWHNLGLSLALSAVVVLLAGEASFNWLHIGFLHGTDQYRVMAMGAFNNLPSLMARLYGWELSEDVSLAWLGLDYRPTVQTALRGVYAVLLLLCAGAAAWQMARRDRGVLVALGGVWLMMVAVLPQMHERYMLYPAVLTALAASVRPSLLPLHLLLTACSAQQMFLSLPNRPTDTWWAIAAQQTHPHLSWAVLLTAAIWLYQSFRGSWRGMKSGREPAKLVGHERTFA